MFYWVENFVAKWSWTRSADREEGGGGGRLGGFDVGCGELALSLLLLFMFTSFWEFIPRSLSIFGMDHLFPFGPSLPLPLLLLILSFAFALRICPNCPFASSNVPIFSTLPQEAVPSEWDHFSSEEVVVDPKWVYYFEGKEMKGKKIKKETQGFTYLVSCRVAISRFCERKIP